MLKTAQSNIQTITILLFLALVSPSTALAQFEGASLDVGYSFSIQDSDVIAGDIVISTEGGLKKAAVAYDNKLFGVVQAQPAVFFRVRGQTGGQPISRAGVVEVNVTTLNGAIKVGDYITSSPISGKGQKAEGSGYVIGTALGAFKEGGQTQTFQGKTVTVGKIPVALKIEYAEITAPRDFARLFSYLSGSIFQNIQDPQKFAIVIRYSVAGFIAIASFLLGFFTFAKSVPKGVEAVGRNPLAKGAIQFSMILNIILTVITTLIGIVASVLILRL